MLRGYPGGIPPRLSATGVGAGVEIVEVLDPVESEDDEQAAKSAAQASRRVGDIRMGLIALPVGREE
jgi:hypothetical protein